MLISKILESALVASPLEKVMTGLPSAPQTAAVPALASDRTRNARSVGQRRRRRRMMPASTVASGGWSVKMW